MLIILTQIANICDMFELTKGQGHKVKGQGQSNKYSIKLIRL